MFYKIIRTIIIMIFAFTAGLIFWVGCGTSITIEEEEYIVEAPPSDTSSAGVLSGFQYSTGGDHYKVVQSLGGPLPETIQESDNGAYSVK